MEWILRIIVNPLDPLTKAKMWGDCRWWWSLFSIRKWNIAGIRFLLHRTWLNQWKIQLYWIKISKGRIFILPFHYHPKNNDVRKSDPTLPPHNQRQRLQILPCNILNGKDIRNLINFSQLRKRQMLFRLEVSIRLKRNI